MKVSIFVSVFGRNSKIVSVSFRFSETDNFGNTVRDSTAPVASPNLNTTAKLYQLQHRNLPSVQRELKKLNNPQSSKQVTKNPVANKKRKAKENLNLRKKQ
jgi:hypothetical protein